MKDGRLSELGDDFLQFRLDSKNGKAAFVNELEIKRNASYVLILKLDKKRSTIIKGKRTHPLQEVGRLTNPKQLATIRNFAKLLCDDLD